jgi:hypothetical protein
MEIQVYGQGAFACEVFDLDPAFHGFVIFFHWPSIMVDWQRDDGGIAPYRSVRAAMARFVIRMCLLNATICHIDKL